MRVPRLLIGTFIAGRDGDAARREATAQVSVARLADAGHAACTDLAFADASLPAAPVPSLRVLRLDAPSVTGVPGIRKPIVSELLDALASEAERRGLARIALVNGDIIVTPEAVQRSVDTVRPAIAIARTDFGGGEAESQLLYGVDMFVFDVAFWRRERRRFRAYPLGEGVWDNVYAAVAVAHGGVLLNRDRLILHERHARAWHQSPYATYVHQLAARDGSYFSQWCAYVSQAEALRARGGSPDDELALQRATFHPPGVLIETVDVARAAWWRLKRGVRGA